MASSNNHHRKCRNRSWSRKARLAFLPATLLLSLPCIAQDSSLADGIGGLQASLEQVHQRMILHSSELIGIASAIAGFATMWHVAGRLYRQVADGEDGGSIKMIPLLRPFAIGMAIFLFPSVIGLIDGVMQPTVDGTAALVRDGNQALSTLLQQKEQALQQSADWKMYVGPDGNGSLQDWELLSGQADSGIVSGIANSLKFKMARAAYNIKGSARIWLSEILQVCFEAAALCINTVRIFYLIILAIFGPLAFALSVFPGFAALITQWLGRYINIFLWLPVTNIFGSLISQIQQEMTRLDIQQLQTTGHTSFGPTDTGYLIFLIMAIIGYFTVPSITNYIINAGGRSVNLLRTRLLPG